MTTFSDAVSGNAVRVLSYLHEVCLEDANGKEIDFVMVDPYRNGREKGYAVSVRGEKDKWLTAVFSEHRSSDDSVVYLGEGQDWGKDFQMNTYIPSEEVYANATHFRYGEEWQVARFIAEYFRRGKVSKTPKGQYYTAEV
jgi:hypothetical protein